MLRRLAAGMVVAVALSGAAFATGSVLVPAPARALSACTGWTSESIPPDTIRVLRTLGPDAGQVQAVPFRAYVETVMAAEFGPGSPREAMRAGAVAVKQFGWYKAMHWRGGSNSAGQCYDISDNGNDQWYLPISKTPVEAHIEAVAHTWLTSVRKNGRFISTGYWAGPDAQCGTVVSGYRLFQKSASRCARDGMTAEQILRVFYGPRVSIVRPGAHDMNGDGLGDVAVLVDAPGGSLVRLYGGGTLAAADDGAMATGAAWPNPVDAPADAARGIGDVDGDGRADLVYVRPGATGLPEVAVARFVAGGISSAADADSPEQYRAAAAVGTVLEPPTAWWSATDASVSATATMPTALLVADFTGDGLADAAYVSTDPATGLLSIELLVSAGASFAAPVRWWSGVRPSDLVTAVAGDFDGDGRTDIALVSGGPTAGSTSPDEATQPAAAGTLRVAVLLGTGDETFDDPDRWGSLPVPAGVTPVVLGGDWNRDGSDDLMTLWSNRPSGLQATALLSDGKTLKPTVFRSTDSGFNMDAARFATADVNGDGRTDVVAFYDAGAAGTRMIPFTSTGTRLAALRSTLDPTTPWNALRPF